MQLRAALALLPILLGLVSGCVWTGEAQRASWRKRFDQQPIAPEFAQIQVAILERPIGDEYLNDKLWDGVDQMICRRGILEDNGFRIGQLVGAPAEALQQMLLSSQFCTPKGMVFPTDRSRPIELGPVRAQTAYRLILPKQESLVELKEAGFLLDVAASFTPREHTKLTFTPKVENGETVLPFRARPDQSTWELHEGRASRQYPEMSWDATLGTNQYLLIGAWHDRRGTLGWTMFTQAEAGVQKLLVIRNCRPATGDQPSAEDRLRSDKTTPLALQAQNLKR